MTQTANKRTAVALLLVSVLAVWSGTSAADETAPCRVARKVGGATIQHNAAIVSAETGAPVAAGDRVVTAAGGRVEIGCSDGSTIVVGEQSDVSLAIFDRAGGERRRTGLLDLLAGILRLHIPPDDSGGRIDVLTATAVASARSTHWIVDAKPGTTGVFVAEGSVAVSARDGRGAVLLQPGFGTDVPAGGVPTPPKRWGQQRVDSAMARTALP